MGKTFKIKNISDLIISKIHKFDLKMDDTKLNDHFIIH